MLFLFFAAMCVTGASVSKMEAKHEHGDNLTKVEVQTQPNVAKVEVKTQPIVEVGVNSQANVAEVGVKSQPNITEVEVKPQPNITEVEVNRQPRFFTNVCNAFCAGVNFAPILCPLGFFWAPVIFCNDVADAGVAALIGGALIIG